MANDGPSFRSIWWGAINGKVSDGQALVRFAEAQGFAPVHRWAGQIFRGEDRDGNRLGVWPDGRFMLTGRTARAVAHLIDGHAKEGGMKHG